jgi:quercetin dioxygenase-like cupin family protein
MADPFSNAFQVRDANPPGEGKPTGGAWIHHTDRCSVVVAYFPPEGGMRPHLHETHDEIITLVEGRVEFRVGDQVRMLGPGDVVTVPAKTVHAPLHTPGGCTIVSVFAPEFDPDDPDRVFVDD